MPWRNMSFDAKIKLDVTHDASLIAATRIRSARRHAPAWRVPPERSTLADHASPRPRPLRPRGPAQHLLPAPTHTRGCSSRAPPPAPPPPAAAPRPRARRRGATARPRRRRARAGADTSLFVNLLADEALAPAPNPARVRPSRRPPLPAAQTGRAPALGHRHRRRRGGALDPRPQRAAGARGGAGRRGRGRGIHDGARERRRRAAARLCRGASSAAQRPARRLRQPRAAARGSRCSQP